MAGTGIVADSWMTGIGPYDTDLNWEDCSDLLAAAIVTDTTTLGQIRKGPPATDKVITWVNDELNPVTFQGSMASSDTLVISSPTDKADIERILRENAVFGVQSPPSGTTLSASDYAMRVQVTSAASSTVSCAMYGNTSFATQAAGTTFVVYSMPKADNDSVSPDISRPRTLSKNYTQVFERGLEIQKTREAIRMKAVPDELKLQFKRRTLEIKRELNMTVIGGYPLYSGGAFTGDSQLSTMAGLYYMMRDPDLDATVEDTMVSNASGKALTVARLNDALYEIESAGGADDQWDPIILCSPAQARKISKFDEELIRRNQEDTVTGHYVDTFVSDLGVRLPIIHDRYWPADMLMIADRSRILLRPLKGDDLHVGEVAADSDRIRLWQMSMQYTLQLECPEQCHYLIHSLKTS